MKQKDISKKILRVLYKNKKDGLGKDAIKKVVGVRKSDFNHFDVALNKLCSQLKVFLKNGKFYIADLKLYKKCQIVKITNSYAFAEGEGVKYYIKGSFTFGAMLGDFCLLKQISHFGNTPEAKVVEILKESKSFLLGTVKQMEKGFGFVYDLMPNFVFKVGFGKENGAKDGDKVLASIKTRGKSHFSHIVEIKKVFGNSESAESCCNAILMENNIKKRFDKKTLEEAKDIFDKFSITSEDIESRDDLRHKNIFTIDAAESKDLDDAISIEKRDGFYFLSVHIADVSHYVTPRTSLDQEAFTRATSVYYANSVIPMLPKEISNGVCSLNEKEDKLCFSCHMKIDVNGFIKSYTFRKSVINSKVKGIYSEINDILQNKASKGILGKYSEILEDIALLNELSDIITKKNKEKFVLDIESHESKIILDENKKPIDIIRKSRGKSEKIIENCMVLANESAALFSKEFKLPFIYRVHEKPKPKKIEHLKFMLLNVGLSERQVNSIAPPYLSIGKILDDSRGSDVETFIHTSILRSMEKAKYRENSIGHFGLGLDYYSHFTSPIRRYPDLVIHRILSYFIYESKNVSKFSKFCVDVSSHSSLKEVDATNSERACENAYKAEYMKGFIGHKFNGVISSVTNFGVYVEIENTVEGLVKIVDFEDGNYTLIDNFKYVETNSKREYKIGTKVVVELMSVSVSLGNIDFKMVKQKKNG